MDNPNHRLRIELLDSYTGAPYFSAIASARLGADLVPSLHPSIYLPSTLIKRPIFPTLHSPTSYAPLQQRL